MKREDWKTVEDSLAFMGAQVKLICDGYEITLQLQRNKMKLSICVYINGWIRGDYMMKDCEERRRFVRPVTKCYRKPFTAKQVRLLGKKWCDEQMVSAMKTYYLQWWPSLALLRRHFEKHNASIELAPVAALKPEASPEAAS